MELPSIIEPYRDRPVAILGLGVSGHGAMNLLQACNLECHGFDEAKDKHFLEQDAGRYGLVVYSPGFAQDHPWLESARKAGCYCLGELDLAALFWQNPIIAVTGTNGKTTLVKLLAEAYESLGVPAVATGNVGHSFSNVCLDYNETDCIAICEVSSYQAEGLKHFYADALIWINFDEDHLDRHLTLENYFKAKHALLATLRRPCFIAGRSVAQAADKYRIKLPGFSEIVDDQLPKGFFLPEGPFAKEPQLQNYLMAHKYWELEGLDVGQLTLVCRDFYLPPHRLQKIAEVDGIAFWDDSKGTNFSAAIAALSVFPDPVRWIGGGKDRGGDKTTFLKSICPKVKKACLIGETRFFLEGELKSLCIDCQCFTDISLAVEAAFGDAIAGESVVLSPGFASWDQFKSYADRGISFKNAVLSLNQSIKI